MGTAAARVVCGRSRVSPGQIRICKSWRERQMAEETAWPQTPSATILQAWQGRPRRYGCGLGPYNRLKRNSGMQQILIKCCFTRRPCEVQQPRAQSPSRLAVSATPPLQPPAPRTHPCPRPCRQQPPPLSSCSASLSLARLPPLSANNRSSSRRCIHSLTPSSSVMTETRVCPCLHQGANIRAHHAPTLSLAADNLGSHAGETTSQETVGPSPLHGPCGRARQADPSRVSSARPRQRRGSGRDATLRAPQLQGPRREGQLGEQ